MFFPAAIASEPRKLSKQVADCVAGNQAVTVRDVLCSHVKPSRPPTEGVPPHGCLPVRPAKERVFLPLQHEVCTRAATRRGGGEPAFSHSERRRGGKKETSSAYRWMHVLRFAPCCQAGYLESRRLSASPVTNASPSCHIPLYG